MIRTIGAARDGLGMRVVGLLDDDHRKRNQVSAGHKGAGLDHELEEIARVTGARRLLIAIPTASAEVVRRAVEAATDAGPRDADGARARRSWSRAAWTRPRSARSASRISSGASPVVIDEAGLRELVAGKTVLVTGAGGSIGSELARQVFDLDPARLVLLDRAEGPLYDIERELALLAARDSGPTPAAGHHRATLVTRLVERRQPRGDGPGDGRGSAGARPPRRGLQARPDDGAAPGRRGLHEHRRDADSPARARWSRRRTVRPGLDGQGRRAVIGDGGDEASRRAGGRRRSLRIIGGRTSPSGSGTSWARRGASCRSSSASSGRACR